MSMSCAISDSDISGPGVRISFYLQSFLLVILVDRDENSMSISLWTFTATNFGLQIAAITEYANSALTLLEALQVSNLLWLANFGIFFALASYSRSKRKSHRKHKKSGSNGLSGNTKAKEERKESDYGVKTASMLQTLLSFALTLYMWANPEKFSDPPCVETLTYVLFAWKISILQNGRIVGLAFSTLLSCAYIAITLHEYWISYLKRKSKKTQTNEYSPPPTTHLSPPPSAMQSSLNSSDPLQTSFPKTPKTPTSPFFPPQHSSNRPERKLWSDIDPMFVGILIFEVIVFIYLIVSNEILLRVNEADTGGFGFGQILALVVVLPVLLSVIDAFREHGLRPRGRRSKRSKSKRHRGRLARLAMV